MSVNINETNNFQNEITSSSPKNLSSYLNQVFLWMMFALAISTFTVVMLGMHPKWEYYILSSSSRFTALLLIQLAMVFVFRWVTQHFSLVTAILFYALYSMLTGTTLSIVLELFTSQSIIVVFCATSVAFGGLSLFGYLTKRDLGPVGNFCMMGLFGLITVGLMSFFVPALTDSVTQNVTSVIGLIVFSGFTAFDVQRLKRQYHENMSAQDKTKSAIIGGLSLYINFINLFWYLLRLTGGRK